MLTAIWNMLTTGTSYSDLGGDCNTILSPDGLRADLIFGPIFDRLDIGRCLLESAQAFSFMISGHSIAV